MQSAGKGVNGLTAYIVIYGAIRFVVNNTNAGTQLRCKSQYFATKCRIKWRIALLRIFYYNIFSPVAWKQVQLCIKSINIVHQSQLKIFTIIDSKDVIILKESVFLW